MTTLAYAYASGLVGFGDCPKGALPIGYIKKMESFKAQCRHAYDGHSLLVPGVPEASDQIEGVDKLMAFIDRLTKLKIIK